MTTGRKGAIDVKQTKKTDLLLSKMREFELIWFPFTDREPPPPKKKKKNPKQKDICFHSHLMITHQLKMNFKM